MNAPSDLGEDFADTRVSPFVALALLNALRDTDTPEETLEDEDLARSLPRRLGLSRAVDAQIRRYRELSEGRTSLRAEEVADLFVLVARRPDAVEVFHAAGRWLTGRRLAGRRVKARILGIPLPESVRIRLALRAARQVALEVSPGGRVRIERDPDALVLEGSLPVRACGSPRACELVSAALARSLESHGLAGDDPDGEPEEGGGDSGGGAASGPTVLHPLCEARDEGACVWRSGPVEA